jgi:hypothetical protein
VKANSFDNILTPLIKAERRHQKTFIKQYRLLYKLASGNAGFCFVLADQSDRDRRFVGLEGNFG